MGLRLIQGGRATDGLPGLLVEHAAEIATLAGGMRTGVADGRPGVLEAPGGDFDHDAAPAVACWEGRILAAGPRNDLLQALEGSGYPLARFARLDAAGGTVTPGLIDPHTHLLFAGSREGELVLRQRGADYLEILKAGGGILSTVEATRAASRGASSPSTAGAGSPRCCRHGTTTIEAKSGYGLDLPTELRLLEVAHRLGKEGPVDVLPTWLGAHAVAPEFRARPDGTEAYVRHLIEEQLPGRRRAGPGALRRRLLRARRVQPGAGAARPRGGGAAGARAAAARRRAGTERRRGARRGDRRALGGPPRGAVAGGHRRAGGGGARRAARSSRSLLPATTWFLMHDEVAPGPDVHRAGHPGRARHRLQPRDVTDARACRS